MSTQPTDRAEHSELGDTLRRELDAARRRLAELERRRHTLERELDGVTAAEEQSRQALRALESIARQAPGLVDESNLDGAEPEDVEGPGTAHALAGGELRETLTRVALRRNAHGDAVHWSEWLGWLRDEGFDAAGKRAEATFQTQLARSPLVRRTDRDGVYVLDVELLGQLRDELLDLHRRMEALPGPGQLTLIGDAREVRRELLQRIGRTERRLEEAWRTLTEELGSDWSSDHPPDTDDVARMWLGRREHVSPET